MANRPRHEIVRGRHTDYTTTEGIPIVVKKPSVICYADTNEFLEGRHIDYTAGGIPVHAWATRCCRFLTDERVGSDCWPPDTGTFADTGTGLVRGIAPRVWAVSRSALNCASANLREIELVYNEGLQVWQGVLTGLIGGDLTLEWWCDAGALWLYWSGCGQEGLSVEIPTCGDPLIVGYTIEPRYCCCCPHTTAGAQVRIDIYANCYPVVFGRHIGYTATGIPIVATDSCPLPEGQVQCDTLTCGLQAVITSTSTGTGSLDDCSCLAATYRMYFINDHWEIDDTKCDGKPITLRMDCLTDTGTDFAIELGTGTGSCWSQRVLRYLFTITCGASNTGSAQATISICDVDDFRIEFDIDLFAAAEECTGDCTWQWNEMALAWSLITPCTGIGCECATPPGDGISGAGIGAIDGQTTTTPCATPGNVVCCTGSIHVVVTRDCGTGT